LTGLILGAASLIAAALVWLVALSPGASRQAGIAPARHLAPAATPRAGIAPARHLAPAATPRAGIAPARHLAPAATPRAGIASARHLAPAATPRAGIASARHLAPAATPRAGIPPAGLPAPRSATGGAPAGSGAVSGALAQVAAASPRRRVEVIIQLKRGVGAARGPALVRSLGGQPGLELPIINGLSARLTAAAAVRLAGSPLVHAVSLNAPLKETTLSNPTPWTLATSFDQAVGATRLWWLSTGTNIGVAVIDTGISGYLPDFQTAQGSSTSRVVASAVIDPNATTADDAYGHGTAVAGLVAGNGWYRNSNDPLYGQYAGTAPDANLISVNVSDDEGNATTLDAIYGLQFVVDHQADYNIRVVNLSFRSTQAESYTTDPLDAAVEAAWFDGITVVAAAGNLGNAPDAVDYSPGNDPYVMTVGASDEQGTSYGPGDVEASWSSQGTTQDGFTKPDVLAPGAHILTTLAPNSAFATMCPTCVIDGSYFQVSGTSLAAPIVAGIAADLLAAHPNWTPDMVKGAIVNTAVPLQGGGNEIRALRADFAGPDQLVSDQNLTPNGLIDPSTGAINYSAGSWSAGSWSIATGPIAATWSTASWTCDNCSSGTAGDVSPTAGSWSTVGWATNWG
jgi:serine protease AprX